MLGGGISVIPDTSTEFMNCSWYEPISACASQLCFSLCNFLRVVYQDGVLPRSLLDRTLCRCRRCTVSGWPPPYYLFLSYHLTSIIISTEGALRRPMTFDKHPFLSHPIRHIALNELNRPKIDLSQHKMT